MRARRVPAADGRDHQQKLRRQPTASANAEKDSSKRVVTQHDAHQQHMNQKKMVFTQSGMVFRAGSNHPGGLYARPLTMSPNARPGGVAVTNAVAVPLTIGSPEKRHRARRRRSIDGVASASLLDLFSTGSDSRRQRRLIDILVPWFCSRRGSARDQIAGDNPGNDISGTISRQGDRPAVPLDGGFRREPAPAIVRPRVAECQVCTGN